MLWVMVMRSPYIVPSTPSGKRRTWSSPARGRARAAPGRRSRAPAPGEARRETVRRAAHRVAHQDLAAERALRDARGHVHLVADEIARARARRAGVDADAETHAPRRLLHLERGAERRGG